MAALSLKMNATIIGDWICHEKFGGNHAGVNATNSARENLEGASLYINLEPCSHQGKNSAHMCR
ncbi:MAG: hypothetical protein MZV64_03435 [Ignavibacteriales bacterium]|nr:hypothetical protein [Ignavibacteriales bacterium]